MPIPEDLSDLKTGRNLRRKWPEVADAINKGEARIGVQSVTGNSVDNTDPLNPIILDGAYIILESRTTQSISTDQANPTELDNWTVLESNLISLQENSIRNDSGKVIKAMHGTIGIHPVVDGGGNRLINITSERSPDGITYTISDQNRPIFTNSSSETYNTKESYLTNFGIGEYVRFIAHADSAMSIGESSTNFRNQVVTGPAMLWILHEV